MLIDVFSKIAGNTQTVDPDNISLQSPSIVRLKIAPEAVRSFVRDGDDLKLVLATGEIVVIGNFFVQEPDGTRNDLVLEDAAGVLWWGQYSTPWQEFHFTEIETEGSAASPWWLLAGLGLLGLGAAAASGGGGTSGGPVGRPQKPVVEIKDIDVVGDMTVITGTITVPPGTVPDTVTVIIDGVEYPADVDEDGTWQVEVPVGELTEDTPVTVIGTVRDPKTGEVSDPSDPDDDVIPIEFRPEVEAPAITTNEDEPFTGKITGTGQGGNPPTYTIPDSGHPKNGTVTIDPVTGEYTYTPDPDYNGEDSFTVTVTDEGGGSTTVTVQVTVNPVNDPPAGADNTITLPEDGGYPFGPADFGFSDPVEGHPLKSVIITTLPTAGSLTFDGQPVVPGQSIPADQLDLLVFTPDPDANGENYANFTFQVRDGGGTENGGIDTDPTPNTITINVTPVPDITDDTLTTDEDTPITFNVLTGTNGATPDNFEDPGRKVTAITQPEDGGIVEWNPDGTFTFIPDSDWNGTTTFTYTVTSGNGRTETATVTINVNPVNDAPFPVGTIDDQASLDAEKGIGLNVSKYFDDRDDATLTYTATGLPKGLTLDPDTGLISGTIHRSASQDGDNGRHEVVITATDGRGATTTQVFTWTVTNPAPIANDDTASTDEDTALTGNVLTGEGAGDIADTDPDGDPLRVTSFTVDTNGDGGAEMFTAGATAEIEGVGTLVLNENGSYTFTPAENWNGTVPTVTYTISDREGGTDTATLIINVNPVNDPPAGTDNTITLLEDGSHSFTPGDFGFEDPVEGDEFKAVIITTLPTTGSLTFDGEPVGPGQSIPVDRLDELVFTPDPDANGENYANFTFQVQDDGGTDNEGVDTDPTPNTITINITPVDDITDDEITTPEDEPVSFNVLTGTGGATPDDFEDEGRRVTSVTEPEEGGTIEWDADGNFTFTPEPDWNGTTTFTYTVTSGNGVTETATVTVTVGPKDDIADDLALTSKNTPITVDVLGNDDFDGDSPTITNVDGQPITVGEPVTVENGSVTLEENGTLTFTPNEDWSGETRFEYTVTSGGVTETATVTVNVIDIDIIDDNSPGAPGTGDDVLASIDDLENVTLTGRAPVGGTITSLIVTDEDGIEVSIDPATIVINSDGSFSTTADLSGLKDGTLTVTLNVQDSGGNSGAITDTIHKDTTVDVVIDPLFVVNGEVPVITGSTSDPEAETVTLTINGTEVSVPVEEDGTWSYTPPAPLAIDETTISAGTSDPWGNTATVERKVAGLTIEDQAPGESAPEHIVVHESALEDGTDPDATTESVSATFTLATTEGGIERIVIGGSVENGALVGGTSITLAELVAATPGLPIEIETTYGKLFITGYEPGTGVVSYTYTLNEGTEDHEDPGGDIVRENIQLAVVDDGGDTRVDQLIVAVVDDVPVITEGTDPLPELLVDESDLTSATATAEFGDAFSYEAGADGEQSRAYSLVVNGGASGLKDVATGQAIVLVDTNGDGTLITGHVGDATGESAFTITIDDQSGAVTLTQLRALEHGDSGVEDTTLSLTDAALSLRLSVTDKDDDTTTSTIDDIGGRFQFTDDVPAITPSTDPLPELLVDESDLTSATATAEFGDAFSYEAGADGEQSRAYSLVVNGGASGLKDVATGQAIVLVDTNGDGTLITGHVGDATGESAFTITIDDQSGAVTLTQLRALEHGDSGVEDTTLSLTDAALSLRLSVTDKDDDTTTSTIDDIGGRFQFTDDVPVITAGTGDPELSVEEASLNTPASLAFAGLFDINHGADGEGAVPLQYSLSVGSAGVDSGLVDTETGTAI
ncbi:tandem-95 repeat protein, partial [Alcaligenaceae bacterium]|nr:tandem-95 repeat protein [Alcaligenaceae bacterium]